MNFIQYETFISSIFGTFQRTPSVAHLKSTIYEDTIKWNEAVMHNKGSTRDLGLEALSVQNREIFLFKGHNGTKALGSSRLRRRSSDGRRGFKTTGDIKEF